MAFWNKEICGFEPYNNAEGTLLEYSEEQINTIIAQGDIVVGEDGLPQVVPRPQPTEEDKQAQYKSKVESLIRERYTVSQELAILRQQSVKTDEYEEYYAYCEECKKLAREEVYGDEV